MVDEYSSKQLGRPPSTTSGCTALLLVVAYYGVIHTKMHGMQADNTSWCISMEMMSAP